MSDIVDRALQVAAESKSEAKSEAKATVKKSKDWKYDAKVVVERKDGNLNITGNLEQSSAGPCSDYLPLRRTAAGKCGGEVSSQEAMQTCLRRNQGQACMDAFPNDPLRRNECIACINLASADPRLHGSRGHCGSSCGCSKRKSSAHSWFFLSIIIILLIFVGWRACSCKDAPKAQAGQ